RAYFGQKDAQQAAIVKRLVRDFNIPVEIISCPIVREEDGLAKSSRNTYLSAEERREALVLSKAVFLGSKMAKEGESSAEAVLQAMTAEIMKSPMAKIDYIKAVDGLTMEQ
ncbi:MAG: pantoate--beta-alanine ligase, partial [Hungatella sp.]